MQYESKKKDGHVGGTTHIVQCGTVPQTMCCVNDHRFTILPFTSASGHAVCCVVIFTSDNDEGVNMLWKSGVDIRVDNVVRDAKNEIDFKLNKGEGKFYPGGPKCMYNRKEVVCLTFASESGGVNGKILVEILTYFDELDLFPCTPNGPIPMLLVDGHQSRLNPGFNHYIDDPHHEWRVCFGVPYAYATVLWQVGDSSEQNGKFKSEWYGVKDKLMQ